MLFYVDKQYKIIRTPKNDIPTSRKFPKNLIFFTKKKIKMKPFQTIFLFAIALFFASPIFSQDTSQDFRDRMGKTLDELDDKQRAAVLQHAITLIEAENSKKAIARVAEHLSKADQNKLYEFATMEKYGLNNNTPAVNVTPPAEPAVPVGPTTTIEFEESVFDFGVITSGEKVSYVYKFKNTGSEPLIIKNAKGSCGCTVPQWPKEPIAPGATGELLVEFNSKGKSGKQNKRVTITANTTPAQTFINIKGEVLKEGK